MSEKIIHAKKAMTCDLCGQLIQKGEKCRMIRDDFMPLIVHFEHVRCPGACAVITAPKSVPPLIHAVLSMT